MLALDGSRAIFPSRRSFTRLLTGALSAALACAMLLPAGHHSAIRLLTFPCSPLSTIDRLCGSGYRIVDKPAAITEQLLETLKSKQSIYRSESHYRYPLKPTLTRENGEILLIEHDRTPQSLQLPMGSGSGVIILKSCILELRSLPFPCGSDGRLNSTEASGTSTECAFQNEKRKTQQSENRTGAKQ